MNQIVRTKLGEGRRVAIPTKLCHQYHLKPGTPVVLEASEAGIILTPLDAVIRDVQAFFVDAAPPEVGLSGELLKERRAEAKRDSCG